MRGQLHRDENRHRAVRAADDADSTRFVDGKAAELGENQRDKNAQMRTRAQNHQLGVGDHRAEIGHRAHAEKDQRRNNQLGYAFVGIVKQATFLHHIEQR